LGELTSLPAPLVGGEGLNVPFPNPCALSHSGLTTQHTHILFHGTTYGLHPLRHIIIGHFRDKSFQAITCTGTDNSKQTGENTPKTQKILNKQTGLGKKNTKNPELNLD